MVVEKGSHVKQMEHAADERETMASINLTTVYLKPDESFTIQVEGLGDTREIFVWLHKNGTLSFNDEHFADRPNGKIECMSMDEGEGWIAYEPDPVLVDDKAIVKTLTEVYG